MRFHTLRPPPSLPSSGTDAFKVQRAAPTCTVSLTSVSVTASMSGTSTNGTPSLTSTTSISFPSSSMDVDPVSNSSLSAANLMFQFPTSSTRTKTKRTHSLLRPSTLSGATTISTKREETTGGERESAEEQDDEAERDPALPARKRTRTCAMVNPAVSPSRGRNLRRHSISSSSRSSSAPAQHKYESFDELLSQKAAQTIPDASPPPTRHTTPGPSSPPSSPPPSAPEAVTLILSPREHLAKLQAQPNNLAFLVPIPPSPLYRKRRLQQVDSYLLLYLYRTLVYGIQVRFNTRVQDSSSLDVQDAILALRLRAYLLRRKVSSSQLIVDLDSVASEAAPSGSLSPEEEVASNNPGRSEWMRMLIAAQAAKSVRHTLHLEPSTKRTVRSYQQLAASLIFRHFTEGSIATRHLEKRRRQARREGNGIRQCPPSMLRQSMSALDFAE